MYEEYMRDLLGWRSPDIYGNSNNYRNMMLDNNINIEECYPEIYRIIYPMVQKACMQNTNPVTKEVVDQMTQEIYNNIEAENVINLNINLSNEVRSSASPNDEIKSVASENREENRVEDRVMPGRRNFLLNDLIKILLVRELSGRPGRPGLRPRPSMMPREFSSYNLV